MGKTIIDLSSAIKPNLSSDPEMMIPKFNYINHVQGAYQRVDISPGLKKEQLP